MDSVSAVDADWDVALADMQERVQVEAFEKGQKEAKRGR